MPTESAKSILQGGFSRTRDDDRLLAALAEQQHGVVSRRQLMAAGWSKGSIEKRIRSGRLHRLHAGTYLVGHRLIDREGRWMAAVLASAPNALLSHYSAAHLWMIRPNSRKRIDVTVPHRSRSSAQIRRHISPVPDDERTVEEGIPVTTVPRTILDLALDRLKEDPVGRRRSVLEERFAPFLRRHRLPLPRFNNWIVLGDKRCLVDCHWPDLRVIVELDGWDGHSTRTAFREDRARDRRLAAAGYTVTRVTWNQLEDEPGAVAADLRTLLARPR